MELKNYKSLTSQNQTVFQLKLINNNGPRLQNHIVCELNHTIYIHGGLNSNTQKTPQNQLYRFELDSGWQKIDVQNSPTLSHHCVIVHDGYMILIGGWNGSKRVSDVYVYNPGDNSFQKAITTGFPLGAGLSNHTSTKLNDNRIIIFGREGSIRTQRKYGNCYILDGDPRSLKYTYTEYNIDTASRSGHSTIAINNNLILIGGRKDKVIEVHKLLVNDSSITCKINEEHLNALLQNKALKKEPYGRRNAICFKINENLGLIHGGESFGSNFENPLSDIISYDVNKNIWYGFGETGVGLKSHVVCNFNGNIIIHGGCESNNRISNLTYQLLMNI